MREELAGTGVCAFEMSQTMLCMHCAALLQLVGGTLLLGGIKGGSASHPQASLLCMPAATMAVFSGPLTITAEALLSACTITIGQRLTSLSGAASKLIILENMQVHS